MGSVALEVFLAVDLFFLFLFCTGAILYWDMMQNFKTLRAENQNLMAQINNLLLEIDILSERLETAIRQVSFYRNEAIGIARDYQAHLAETKKVLTEIAAQIAHYKNENWELKRKLDALQRELEEKTQLIEQLKQRVVARTGPLGGDIPDGH